MCRNHAAGRQVEPKRLCGRWRHGDDLVAGDQTAVDELIGAVIVPAVPDHRTAKRERDIVHLSVGLQRRRREEERARRHVVAAKAKARRPVKAIGARGRDGVVDHPGRLAELRREPVGDDLDLADQHLRDGQQPQAGAVLLGIRVAVDLVVRPHLRAVGVDPGHAELVVFEPGHVGLQEREVVGIARDERQVLDLVLADGAPEVDPAGLRDWRFAGDAHRLGHAADTQLNIDERGLARRERDPLLLERLESLQFRHDAVAAERKEDRAIHPFVVGDRRPGRPGVHVRHGHGDPGQWGVRGVADDALDVAVGGLRLRRRGRRRDQRDERAQHADRQKAILTAKLARKQDPKHDPSSYRTPRFQHYSTI